MARGKELPLAYFYPSVALNGGMCNEDMKTGQPHQNLGVL